MIVALEVLLRRSKSKYGLADIKDEDKSIFWITSAPAALLGLVAFYYSNVDNTTRTLSPFVNLKRGKPFRQTVALDLLDKSRPRIVWTAITVGDFAVISSTMVTMVGALLAIFASSLYKPTPVPITARASIATMDYFSMSGLVATTDDQCVDCNPDTISASLILGANLTYPPWTFEDLAFQTLDTNATDQIFSADQGADLHEMVVSLTLPALRPRLSCRVYPNDEIKMNLTLNGYEIQGTHHPLRIDAAGESCIRGPGGRDRRKESNIMVPTADPWNEDSILGHSGISDEISFGVGAGNRGGLCSDWFYAWGTLADPNTNKTTVSSIGAVGCNETIEVVDVRLQLHGSKLRINPDHPPEVDESSARDAGIESLNRDLYPFLVNATSSGLLDPFFSLLVNSRYAIPLSRLADPSASDEIVMAIHKHHGIIRTQNLNFALRTKLTDGTLSGFEDHGDGELVKTKIPSAFGESLSPEEAVPSIEGEARTVNTRSRTRRVVQNRPTTIILQTLLSVMLFFAGLSWVFSRDDRVPRAEELLSIASMGSLLVDGDLFEYLPHEAEWMRPEELENMFKEEGVPLAFAMGWSGVKRKRGLLSLQRLSRVLGEVGKQGPGVGGDSQGAPRVQGGLEQSVRKGAPGEGEGEEYSSAYGSAGGPAVSSYGIRVLKDGGEVSGFWTWASGRRGYTRGRKSEA